MINNNIKIDLHIHSVASEYKEPKYADGTSIVTNSTIQNVEVLLNRLKENSISLFSITDHNRYDSKLYNEIKAKLQTEEYKQLNVLHGVEFDVQLEIEKKPVHIIVIFDVKTDKDMLLIEKTISNNIITSVSGFYTKEIFEKLLREIKLDTILIVHQKTSLDNGKGNHNSLSEGTSDPYTIIKAGYITALEYQKPNVEGILKNNLYDMNVDIALITGSDCHDWYAYPHHDKTKNNNSVYFSKIKALPTFKGLLLSLTSPLTRFNRIERNDSNYIHSFSINGNDIGLDSGINAIIGENGSGKTTLFQILSRDDNKKYIKDLKKENCIVFDCDESIILHSIKQSELIEKFQKNELFYDDATLFNDINSQNFETVYSNFNEKLLKSIKHNIHKFELKDALRNKNFELKMDLEDTSTLYVNTSPITFAPENEHSSHRTNISNIIRLLINERADDYYDNEIKDKFLQAIRIINDIYNVVEEKEKQVDFNNKIKNIIVKECNDYYESINEISTSEDREISSYSIGKESFVNDIVNAIKANISKQNKLVLPDICEGKSKNQKNGYIFSKETNYNGVDVLEKYLETMFTNNYRDIDKLLNITTKNELKQAIMGCNSIEDIDKKHESNYQKFIEWAKKEKTYIKEETSDDSIGNTLGEMSLVYYKFKTSLENSFDVLMIDQPEDNISNNRIAEKLVKYFNSVRKNKQLIIVTHNPLLVVNLDVDNVIHLNKVNNKINVKAGCLEDEDNEILNLVASTLDGGKEMIERRLKIYE